MAARSAGNANGEKAVLRGLVNYALQGKALAFHEAFGKVLRHRAVKLVNEERTRVASMLFEEVSRSASLQEAQPDQTQAIYNKVYVIDPDLFSKERSHMPAAFQKATPDGVMVPPMKEKDAIDLTKKFNSIEISDN